VSDSILPASCPLAAVLATTDRRFAVHAAAWTAASIVAFGLVAAIIPNPVFGRQVPPEPFAVAIWLASGPLMGLIAAGYTAPPPSLGSAGQAVALLPASGGTVGAAQGSTVATLASLGTFLAIGCPVCNKVALLLLGTTGTLTVFAPLQPLIGVVSLALLGGTLAWRLRLRTRGGACPI
jgi:hypothetical protein